MINSQATVVASAGQVSRELGDEAVILGLDESVYYGLNPVGARIWSLIQEPRRVSAVCETITAEYDVEPERCRRDVIGLLTDLAEQRLIEVRT